MERQFVKKMSLKQKFHFVVGILALAVGIYGFYDEYFNVIDFIKGSTPIIFIVCGVIALVAGVSKKLGE